MIEFRIYYESLEQASDYVKPMIETVLDANNSIILVKRPKKAEHLPKGSLYAIQSWTTPDILITATKDNVEYPLSIIEFTEAVMTEDHELQRTYGALAAYLANCFYIKISGHKKSEKEFGGAAYNPFSTPRILIDSFGYEGYIIADWQTEVENTFLLQKNEFLPACPPIILLLIDTIQESIIAFQKNDNQWFINAIKALKITNSYLAYRYELDKAIGAKELLETWKGRENRNSNLNKLRYFVREKWIGAKINRFSHAMDPDRGILTFLSFVFSDSHNVIGIYALVRKMQILREEIKDLPTLRKQLRIALEKDEWLKVKEESFTKILANELIKVVDNANNLNEVIDFQYFWKKHQSKIVSNKVILTLAYLLDGMYLNQNGIKLVWNRRKLLGDSDGKFLDLLRGYFGFENYTYPCQIREVENEVDEDEVTYIIAHKVLIPNGFKIISISYPGAQGGGAILPEPKKGKEQPREYPDIIAVSPNSNQDVILNESKGMFKQTELERDTAKMLKYKREINYQNALKETLVVAKIIDKQNTIRNILIGIAFGVKSNTQTTWRPDEVDFIFRIVDRKRWSIGIFNQTLRDLIPIIEGNTEFPKVHTIIKNFESGSDI
jgi:hypothetical protein